MKNFNKILIIEDDEALAKTIRNLLSLNGYEVHVAIGGAMGIQAVFEWLPDLIICDIRMQPIDGYQVFNVLKESCLTYKIPFIFLTGKSEIKDFRTGMELGVDDYIVKPFENDDLLTSVKVRLGKYRRLVMEQVSEYRIMCESSSDAYFMVCNDQIVEPNKSFYTITGYTVEDVEDMKLSDLLTEESRLEVAEKIQRVKNNNQGRFGVRCHVRTKGHGEQCYNVIGSGINSSLFPNAILIIMERCPGKKLDKTGNGHHGEGKFDEVLRVLDDEHIEASPRLIENLKQVFSEQNVLSQVEHLSIDIDLSDREREVLELSCEGLPIKLIADKLCISNRTVEKHRASLMAKTGSRSIVEVIIFALRNQLITL
ncbi:response regulator [Puteibacter caeruleilacunae]|nr:response regulator [Puteibacter caeruleilacunae]